MYRSIFGAAILVLAFGPAAAQGDAVKGETAYRQHCALCHALDPKVVRQGPTLLGVFGRKAGTAPNYNYSEAMKAAGFTWDEPKLDAYLKAPRKVVPGGKMLIAIADEARRKDLIAYLKTLIAQP